MRRIKGHISGFTLIELMIVVLIIAILSLIAVPSFLEAQTRSKVARAQSDMRQVALGITAYFTDHNSQPIGVYEGELLLGWGETEKDLAYVALTTPIAYLTKPPADPFAISDYYRSPVYETSRCESMAPPDKLASFKGAAKGGYLWALRSRGPGGTQESDFHPSLDAMGVVASSDPARHLYVYDPSNGVTSMGWIIHTNKGSYTGMVGN